MDSHKYRCNLTLSMNIDILKGIDDVVNETGEARSVLIEKAVTMYLSQLKDK